MLRERHDAKYPSRALTVERQLARAQQSGARERIWQLTGRWHLTVGCEREQRPGGRSFDPLLNICWYVCVELLYIAGPYLSKGPGEKVLRVSESTFFATNGQVLASGRLLLACVCLLGFGCKCAWMPLLSSIMWNSVGSWQLELGSWQLADGSWHRQASYVCVHFHGLGWPSAKVGKH